MKFLYFDDDVIEMCSQGSSGSGNDLVWNINRQLAITQNDNDPLVGTYYVCVTWP